MPLAKSDAQSPHASRERITDTPLERTRPRRRKARVGVLFVLSVPIALAGAVVYVEQVAPKPVHRAIGFLPATLASPVRAGLQYLAGWATAGGDGLRWIEVGDPRSRKADKLPTRVQQ